MKSYENDVVETEKRKLRFKILASQPKQPTLAVNEVNQWCAAQTNTEII